MIISFTLDKISVIKKKEIVGNIEAKNNVKITNISEQNVSAISENSSAVNIGFTFNVIFGKDLAVIELTGKVLYMLDEASKKEMVAHWDKAKKVDAKKSQPILNGILQKCNIKALSLGSEVGLPPHIPFPRLALKSDIGVGKQAA